MATILQLPTEIWLYHDDGQSFFFPLAMVESIWLNGGSDSTITAWMSELPKRLCQTPFPWKRLPLEVKRHIMEYSLHDSSEERWPWAWTDPSSLAVRRCQTDSYSSHGLQMHIGLLQLAVSREFCTIGLCILSRTLCLDHASRLYDFDLNMFAEAPLFCGLLKECLSGIRTARGLLYDDKEGQNLVGQLSYFQALRQLILMNKEKYIWVSQKEGHFEPYSSDDRPFGDSYPERSLEDADVEGRVRECLEKRPEITRLRLLLQKNLTSCEVSMMVYVNHVHNTDLAWHRFWIPQTRPTFDPACMWLRIWL